MQTTDTNRVSFVKSYADATHRTDDALARREAERQRRRNRRAASSSRADA